MLDVRRPLLALALLASAVAAAAGAPGGSADIGCANLASVDSNSAYTYRVCDVPDIDQRRAAGDGIAGLPGDGAYWCVPTSAMNWLAFIANHGYSTVPPFPGDWQLGPPDDVDVYNLMTDRLAALGQVMGTDPAKGTSADGGEVGIRVDLFFGGVLDDFVVSSDIAHGSHSVVTDDMAASALFGALVIAGIGRYTMPADPSFTHLRIGGHAVTLVQATGTLGAGTVSLIGIRDPATGGSSKLTQSPFTTDFYFTKDTTGFFGWVDDDGNIHTGERTLSRVVGTTSGFLDGYTMITPIHGLTFAGTRLVLLKPIDLVQPGSSPIREVAAPGRVSDVAVFPLGARALFLVRGSNAVWALDEAAGTVSRLAVVPRPRQVTVAGTDAYVLLDRAIVAIDRDGRVTHVARAPGGVDDLAYDAANHEIVAISGQGSIWRWDLTLERFFETTVDFIPGDPDKPVTLTADGEGGLWAHRDGSRDVVTFGRGGDSRTVRLEGAEHALGLAADDGGNLFTSDGGVVKVYRPSGERYRSSPLDGLPAGPGLDVLRAYSNYDPATMVGPAWANLDIRSLADL